MSTTIHIPVPVGTRYGRLKTVSPPIRDGRIIWYECECRCGGRKTIRYSDLKRGKTQSCGCLKAEAFDGIAHHGSRPRPYTLPKEEKPKPLPPCLCETKRIDGRMFTVWNPKCERHQLSRYPQKAVSYEQVAVVWLA